jgi:hypothetical protein
VQRTTERHRRERGRPRAPGRAVHHCTIHLRAPSTVDRFAGDIQVHHVPVGEPRHRELDKASPLVLAARVRERHGPAEIEVGAREVDGVDRVVPDVVAQADGRLDRGACPRRCARGRRA